jgi:hypothetical protein
LKTPLISLNEAFRDRARQSARQVDP